MFPGKGEDSSGAWLWTAKQWGAPLESFPPGWKGIIQPYQPLHSRVQECCHAVAVWPEGSASLMVFIAHSEFRCGCFGWAYTVSPCKVQAVSVQVISVGIACPTATQHKVVFPRFFVPKGTWSFTVFHDFIFLGMTGFHKWFVFTDVTE